MNPEVLEQDVELRIKELRKNIDRISAKQDLIDQMLLDLEAKMTEVKVLVQQAKDKEQKSKLLERLARLNSAYTTLIESYNELEKSRIEYEKMITALTTSKHHYNIQYTRLQRSEPIPSFLVEAFQTKEPTEPLDLEYELEAIKEE